MSECVVCVLKLKLFLLGEEEQLSGSYQGATRTGPISSHCWAINVKLIAFHRGKEKQGAGCWLFHFLLAKLQHDAASPLELSTCACNSSFPSFSHLFKQYEQMGLTEADVDHITQTRGGKKGGEGQINRWLLLERAGWGFHYGLSTETCSGEGRSRSPRYAWWVTMRCVWGQARL